MKNIQLELPDSLNLDESEVKLILAAKLFEQGRLSLGKAAELSGYNKREFTELIGKLNISLFNYPPSELSKDVKMHKTIVSDTSCFIVLDNIGELEILKLSYGNILTTQDVADEFGKGLPQWVEKITFGQAISERT